MENWKGFTLIEVLIAIGIFTIIAVALYFSYGNILEIFTASYLNLTAVSVLDNEFELVRNMPYGDVGIQGGSPAGILLAEKTVSYGSLEFTVNTNVRNVDDPFDGLQGGNPNDVSPADYKLVEIEITCPACPRFMSAKAATTIAPPGLETVTNKGTLIIKALDASGQPVSSADVSVVNNSVIPAININDTTDALGVLKLVDIATSSAGFAITVSKTGYSTDRTYQPGNIANPNPLKPHATVLEQQVTEISFVIDRTSTANLRTQNFLCQNIGNIDYSQTGQKLIGTNPDVIKYSASGITNSSGNKTISGLEFDAYDFSGQDTQYDIAGFSPLTPLAVDPNSTYNLTWLMEAKNSSSLLVSVRDSNSQMINDAKVTLSRTGFSSEIYTGRKFLSYTDWSGGQYDSKSSHMSADSPAGELHISLIGGKYASMSDEWLVSNTIDLGTSGTNFYNLDFDSSQPSGTSLKIQLAANNDNATWNYIGPDGTAGSYYTSSGTAIHSGLNGKRYLRYKVFLRTDDDTATPVLRDIKFNFHSSCIPDGQVYFSGLSQNTYTVTVEKAGFQTFTDTAVIIDENREDYRLTLVSQ